MATLHTGQTVTLHMGQMGESVGLVHMSSMVAADRSSSSMLLDRIAEGLRAAVRPQMFAKGDSSRPEQLKRPRKQWRR